MPNRILRDWTDSAKMDTLSFQEEVVFTRLIMKADDFGNFYRNGSLVKSLLFPRKDGLRTSDVDRWLQALEAADLIRCYPAKGDTFLHIVNFKQRLDRTSRKFPQEPEGFDDDNQPPQTAANGFEPPPETKRSRNRNETETEPAQAPRDKFEKKLLLENPFSDTFLETWIHWKEYKKKEFRFLFKSIESEQASLNELVNLSKGNEETAKKIILQSMAKGWKGLFELKNDLNGTTKTNGAKAGIDAYQEAHARRYAERK
jgi:hypothetical protein